MFIPVLKKVIPNPKRLKIDEKSNNIWEMMLKQQAFFQENMMKQQSDFQQNLLDKMSLKE